MTTAGRTRFLDPEAQSKHVHIDIIAICLSDDRAGDRDISGSLIVCQCTSCELQAVLSFNISDKSMGVAVHDG